MVRTRPPGTPLGEGSKTESHTDWDPQELQIAQLPGEGLSNKGIGQQLHLSPRMIGAHLYRIFPESRDNRSRPAEEQAQRERSTTFLSARARLLSLTAQLE
ncbi:LuxR C-terminal-related transcriptional regulator [Streptomyces himalayensis]|uniref:Response regulator transcription factor n=1 Tax=Streptomyces himalayensis subsp. himalayensis TaxID=2756131 RepID=A0A7W0DSM3_9ACTN|nr:LuxR C-terminal-related transcriptional regulator [Streptomyces himalayensis]MBA2950517.1 response regulator transcription factor [Streptomyces himalayensis subsp. himalayensis]